MSEVSERAPLKQTSAESTRARGRRALELVALRGKDVVGVRHVVDGGRAWVGNVADAIARVPARDLGGHPHIVADAQQGTFALHVPPRARARLHGKSGVPRLLIGPHRVELEEGERAVLVLGPVQIRAQVVPFESASVGARASSLGVWVAVVAILYAAALVVSAAITQPGPARVEPGTMQRLHERFLPR